MLFTRPGDLVFPTSTGRPRDRSNILRQIVRPAVAAASARLVEQDLPSIDSVVTNHSLRRTFASLLYEAGASPREVIDQMGHARADLALAIVSVRFTCMVILLGREMGLQQLQSSLLRRTSPGSANAQSSLLMNDPG